MHRRQFILGAALSVLPLPAYNSLSFAQVNDTAIIGEVPPLPNDLMSMASQDPAPYAELGLVGTAKPSQSEIDEAYELLFEAPYGGAEPIDVALHFLAAGSGAYGDNYRKYVREWPVRANPLIFHFFSATQTMPAGDTTAWCAAAMNWWLLRARAKTKDEIGRSPGSFSASGKDFSGESLRRYSTNSASSGSFRCWDEVRDPVRGNIAVFANKGTESLTASCRGTGHVAFVQSVPREGVVRVLGGNQAEAGSSGAITVADMSTAAGSRFMKYVSIKS